MMSEPPLIPDLPLKDKESRHLRNVIVVALVFLVFAVAVIWKIYFPFRAGNELLHVSFDASKSYYNSIDNTFYYELIKNNRYTAQSTHAGSIQQAMGIASGLVADVVSFASPMEIEQIRKRTGCVNSDWRDQFPFGSSPFSSTIVFLVRSGNPKAIKDWEDLTGKQIRVMATDPEVSGSGCYAYLAALIAQSKMISESNPAPDFAQELFKRIRLVPMGAQSAIKVFQRDSSVDVFITWESQAFVAARSVSGMEVDMIYPSVSIMAEPVVTLINCHVEKRHTREAATAYINFLYSDKGQQFAGVHGWRPRRNATLKEWSWQFKTIELVNVETFFGSWENVWSKHFSKNGTWAQIKQLRQAQKGGVE